MQNKMDLAFLIKLREENRQPSEKNHLGEI